MWLLFHRGAKTRLVPDGQCFTEKCPHCRRTARFEEVEQIESYGAFFVDLVDDRERGFRCRECGEVFDLKDDGEPAHEPVERAEGAPRRREAEREAEREADRAVAVRREREAVEAKAIQIEDELAELKKRLGR